MQTHVERLLWARDAADLDLRKAQGGGSAAHAGTRGHAKRTSGVLAAAAAHTGARPRRRCERRRLQRGQASREAHAQLLPRCRLGGGPRQPRRDRGGPRIEQGDAHAGASETSMMLAINPQQVNMAMAEAGSIKPIGEISAQLRSGGVRAVSLNGVLGDPTTATSEHGHNLLSQLTHDLVTFIHEHMN